MKTYLLKWNEPSRYIDGETIVKGERNKTTKERNAKMKRTKKYPKTETFIFTNTNPKGLLTAGDCVIRAISIALNKDWKEVMMGLAQLACETGYAPNNTENFSEYLARNGWKKMPMPKHSNGTKYTTKEFCQEHKTGTFICNIAGHTFCVKNGRVHDTWDVSKYSKRIGNYWKEA